MAFFFGQAISSRERMDEPQAEKQVALPVLKLDESRKLDEVTITRVKKGTYRSASHNATFMTKAELR